MFNKGDLVVCINNSEYNTHWKNPVTNLTVGNIYTVLFSNSPLYGEDTYILIISDNGVLGTYISKHFISLSEYRNNKIYDILK